VRGITGVVDASYFHGSRAQLAALANDAAKPPVVPPPGDPGPPAVWTGPSSLASGARLLPGQQLVSPNHEYRLTLQTDGNLVLYGPSGVPWSTQSMGPRRVLAMQADGNLVLYGEGRPLWSSRTFKSPGTRLELRNDGNMVVVAPGFWPTWMSHSHSAWMLAGKRLVGAYNQFLTSPNGLNTLVMRADGNLVLNNGGRALWATRTMGANRVLLMRTNGSATVYQDSKVLWYTPTGGHPGSALVVNNDGKVIILGRDWRILWSSK